MLCTSSAGTSITRTCSCGLGRCGRLLRRCSRSPGWGATFCFQGLLRGGNPVATGDYAGSVTREFLTLFAWNVGVALIAIGANTLRSMNTPLGYLLLAVQAPRYGAVWGTGSLGVGTGARIEPSLSVLVERSGPLEITAMVAIVVATRDVMIWHQQSGPRWRAEFERVRSPVTGRSDGASGRSSSAAICCWRSRTTGKHSPSPVSRDGTFLSPWCLLTEVGTPKSERLEYDRDTRPGKHEYSRNPNNRTVGEAICCTCAIYYSRLNSP